MNPYKVLGISENASDEDIKKAYRDLARKYHPDNYQDNPLAELANEKMLEINEAYDILTKHKNNSNNFGYDNSSTKGSQNSSVYTQIRNAISLGNIGMAEDMLSRLTNRDAEWHFLNGCVAHKKGWFDEAKRSYQSAASMNPNNMEYISALSRLNAMSFQGGKVRGGSNLGCCSQLICADCCCECCGGDLISCC